MGEWFIGFTFYKNIIYKFPLEQNLFSGKMFLNFIYNIYKRANRNCRTT